MRTGFKATVTVSLIHGFIPMQNSRQQTVTVSEKQN